MAETLRMKKMTQKWTSLLAALVFTVALWGQTAPQPVYVESFRKGRVQISESSLLANLTLENPSYTAVIKDAEGSGRYQLLIEPHRVSEQLNQVMGWQVRLIDVRRKYLGNLLVNTFPNGPLSDQPRDNAWSLDPNPYAPVPLMTERVIKVESFYCVVRVKETHFIKPESRLLDSMRVEVQFTTTDPRAK